MLTRRSVIRRDGKIDAEELEHVFKQLNHKCKKVLTRSAQPRPATHACVGEACTDGACTQADIEDMIWEVDDDCDKAVSWAEFQAMFTRCRNDKSGAFSSVFANAYHAQWASAECARPRLYRQGTSHAGYTTSLSSS